MINNLWKSKVGKLIMILLFATAFSYLSGLVTIGYDDVVSGGIYGWSVINTITNLLDLVGRFIKFSFSLLMFIINNVVGFIFKVANFFGANLPDFTQNNFNWGDLKL